MVEINNRFWRETKVCVGSEYTASGVWFGGVWVRGCWLGGLWKKGTWRDGQWWEGDWEDGIWLNGFWKIGRLDRGKSGWWEVPYISPKSYHRPSRTLSLNYAKYY